MKIKTIALLFSVGSSWVLLSACGGNRVGGGQAMSFSDSTYSFVISCTHGSDTIFTADYYVSGRSGGIHKSGRLYTWDVPLMGRDSGFYMTWIADSVFGSYSQFRMDSGVRHRSDEDMGVGPFVIYSPIGSQLAGSSFSRFNNFIGYIAVHSLDGKLVGTFGPSSNTHVSVTHAYQYGRAGIILVQCYVRGFLYDPVLDDSVKLDVRLVSLQDSVHWID